MERFWGLIVFVGCIASIGVTWLCIKAGPIGWGALVLMALILVGIAWYEAEKKKAE